MLLAISGENGVGKSRLADELIDYLHNSVDAAVLEGACVPYGEANVWFPIANALCRYLDLDPTLPVEEIREVARQRATQLLSTVDEAEVERMVDVFVHLLGHPSSIDKLEAPAARASIHRAVTRVLELRSHERPVVLSINDHDDGQPEQADQQRLAAVGSADDGQADHAPHWPVEQTHLVAAQRDARLERQGVLAKTAA